MEDLLQAFIDQYPEDGPKWFEFVRNYDIGPQINNTVRPNRDIPLDENLLEGMMEINNVKEEEKVENHENGCIMCGKSWISLDLATTTLLCGHKFHTLCMMVKQYYGYDFQCYVDGCDMNQWRYVREIHDRQRHDKNKLEDILINSYLKRSDFKKDLHDIKECVSDISKRHTNVSKLITQGRMDIIHKYIIVIRQIQSDINNNLDTIKKSQEMSDFRTSLRKYRAKASKLFNKYHLSFRDLTKRRKISASWKIRSILERHRSAFTFYNLGLKIRAGKFRWKDPLV